MTAAPVGQWVSPITSELITASSISLGAPQLAPGGEYVYWAEGRPTEKGRQVLCRQCAPPCTASLYLLPCIASSTRCPTKSPTKQLSLIARTTWNLGAVAELALFCSSASLCCSMGSRYRSNELLSVRHTSCKTISSQRKTHTHAVYEHSLFIYSFPQIYRTASMQLTPHQCVLFCRALGGGPVQDVTPGQESGFNVRTRVHEYGGGAYALADDAVYFSNFKARARLPACSPYPDPSASNTVCTVWSCPPVCESPCWWRTCLLAASTAVPVRTTALALALALVLALMRAHLLASAMYFRASRCS